MLEPLMKLDDGMTTNVLKWIGGSLLGGLLLMPLNGVADAYGDLELLWGDTHLHTAMSGDAAAREVILEPDAAYRFARGEPVASSTGQIAQLARPLDWIVIADHGNNMGAGWVRQKLKTDPTFADTRLGKLWLEAKQLLADGHIDARALEEKALLPAHRSWQAAFRAPAFRKSIWQRVGEKADSYNDPGTFTTFIGYEWTPSQEQGSSEHRVVLFADDASKTKQILPYTSYDSAFEEDLWAFLDRYERLTKGRVISIPHNSNLTRGQMFARQDSWGLPLSLHYAALRVRFEPVVEVTQIKGDSETHPYLSPQDQFADFETWDGWTGWRKPDAPVRKQALPAEYVRSALKTGLDLERVVGANPYRFGVIGSTDSHTGLATADEDNFWGKSRPAEPSKGRMTNLSAVMNWQMAASGYAAVWARENSREAIFEALAQRRVYATTGPRISVRFTAVTAGRSVQMGGQLACSDETPVFKVGALKDPLNANLDRIQIIKGWLDEAGQTREQVYDVALSDGRKDGRIAVGSTVDLKLASYTNDIGSPMLQATWRDPSALPRENAFYYARVLQIPTPRWTLYDKVRYGIDEAPDEVPMVLQERAYTSAIWTASNCES